MRVGGFFVLLVRNSSPTYPMSTRRTYSSRSRLLRRVDNGFIPTASKDFGEITVQCVEFARDSWWHFCVRRNPPAANTGFAQEGLILAARGGMLPPRKQPTIS
jgi:hypothetical protein